MFKWNKLGKLFNPTDITTKSWIHEYAQSPSVVIFDTYVRIYFCSRPPPDKNGMYVSQFGYIDVDRTNLFKIIDICDAPILSLGERGTFDEFGTYPTSVIKTENDFRVYYAGFTRCESVPFNAAIGVAISKDNGTTFNRIGKGPVLSFTPTEPFVMGSPKIRKFNNTWYIWYVAGSQWIPNNGAPQPVYKIRMAESVDGFTWKKEERNLIPSILEKNECQASPDVFHYKGKYHMWFSYRKNLNFKEKKRGYQMGYAYSDDLKHWTRDDQSAGIGTSKQGWDNESISYGFVFELDNRILMLYQGNEIGRFGFGLAELEVVS
jgi:predicted GH43/DUF377 family glycosyl hydrolase